MKSVKYEKVRKVRIEKGFSANDIVTRVNPLREKRGLKPLSASTYYKKETGEVPFFLEEVEDFATVLGKTYRIFFN